MKITNIYLGFEKIRDNIEQLKHFEDVEEFKELLTERELNKQIKRFLGLVVIFGENRRKVCELPTAKAYAFSKSLLLIDYLDYTFLFAVCDDNCIWLNYEEKGKDICSKGIINFWEYLPRLNEKELYRSVSGISYYVVNTYEAFLGFVDDRGISYSATRADNGPFYEKIKEALLKNFPDFFQITYGQYDWLYSKKRIEEGEYRLEIQEENSKICFDALVTDNMIIITHYRCIYIAKTIEKCLV